MYRDGLEALKAEFDEIFPQVDKLNRRIGLLRMAINSVSNLLDEEVDEKYDFPSRNPMPTARLMSISGLREVEIEYPENEIRVEHRMQITRVPTLEIQVYTRIGPEEEEDIFYYELDRIELKKQVA